MGKRHRKGKTRFANTKGIDDALDEQMIEADTDDKRYGKQCSSANQGVQSRNSIGGKVDRNQRRKGKNKKNVAKQRDIIQKGKLFAYNDLDAPNDSTDSPNDLRKLIISKKSSGGLVGWHKITLIAAAKVPRKILFDNLEKFCAMPFSPICVTTQSKNDVSFYVETPIEAKALKDCQKMTIHIDTDYKMTDEITPKEYQVNVRAVSSRPPETVINSKVLDVIKQVMGNRYRAEVKALDLKSFHTDKGFIGESVYAPLNRSVVLKEVIQIIKKEVPNVEAIDFSSNRLPTLNQFSSLSEHATQLRILHLSDNRIANIAELKALKQMKGLKVLKIDKNVALEKRFNGENDLIHSVQKILPSLQSINDINNLPKVVLFEDDEDAARVILPASQSKMLGSNVDQTIDGLIGQFFEQYFKLFDGDSRLPLEAAYHPEATLSVSVCHEAGSSNRSTSKLLSDFQGEIRNLLVVKNMSKRSRLLRKGRLSVIDYLVNYFPKTKHELTSFTLDIPFVAASQLLQEGKGFIGPITITGVFNQVDTSPSQSETNVKSVQEALYGHFNHIFLLVPHGHGFVIVNEMLVLSAATSEEIKALTAIGSTDIVAPNLDTENMKQLVISLSTMTRMKVDWSEKCLSQSGWNLQSAFDSFNIANAEGKIPPDAFQ